MVGRPGGLTGDHATTAAQLHQRHPLDPDASAVTAVLGWEWAHPGDPVEDLAWCEWIVRMHRAPHVRELGGFFDAYGWRPSWARRQAAMLAQCQRLLDLCRRWSTAAAHPVGAAPGQRSAAVRSWEHRLEITAGWVE